MTANRHPLRALLLTVSGRMSRGGSAFGASDRGVLVSAFQGSGLGFSLGQDQGGPTSNFTDVIEVVFR